MPLRLLTRLQVLERRKDSADSREIREAMIEGKLAIEIVTRVGGQVFIRHYVGVGLHTGI